MSDSPQSTQPSTPPATLREQVATSIAGVIGKGDTTPATTPPSTEPPAKEPEGKNPEAPEAKPEAKPNEPEAKPDESEAKTEAAKKSVEDMTDDELEAAIAKLSEKDAERRILMQSDYTRKTQELAALRKEAQSRIEAQESELAKREQALDEKIAKMLDDGYDGQIEEHPKFKELHTELESSRAMLADMMRHHIHSMAQGASKQIERIYGVMPTAEDIFRAVKAKVAAEGLAEEADTLGFYTSDMAVDAYERYVVHPATAKHKTKADAAKVEAANADASNADAAKADAAKADAAKDAAKPDSKIVSLRDRVRESIIAKLGGS